MQQIRISPVQTHVRRQAQSSSCEDMRWHVLNLVRDCRQALDLRDRDVAVLRGLLSLMPAKARMDQRTVFASNRVLSARCDGIEERTLRRRLVHLEAQGLIRRHLSPNGKRYQLRGPEEVVTYGIDLSPLFAMTAHLQALSEAAARDALRLKTLRAMIRDWLFHHPDAPPALLTEARLSLRRILPLTALETLLVTLRDSAEIAEEMSVSDGQTVRHIQMSDKDILDSETQETPQIAASDLSVEDCIELAPLAAELSPEKPRSWSDLTTLAAVLAPAIGVGRAALRAAEARLGRLGCTLAILGLVQAFGRVRKPEAYLSILAKKAAGQGFDPVRMFRSLVRPGGCAA